MKLTIPAWPAPGETLELSVASTTPAPEPVPPTPVVTKRYVGLNLPSPNDWDAAARGKIFSDVWRTARCISGDPATGPSKWRVLTVSNNQVQSANWQTFGSRGAKIAGAYLLSWSGGGVVTASNGVWASPTKLVITDESRDVDINFSQALTGIPRMVREGETGFVTRAFKKFVEPFSCIRTMDLQMTNWADEFDAAERYKTLGADKKMDWAERPSDTGSYHRAWGISLECAVRMCNETMKDLWFNFPWCHTLDYRSNAVAYVLTNLNSQLKFHFEVGNENPWNPAGGFYHANLVAAEAEAFNAAGLSPLLSDPSDGAPQNKYYLGTRWVAMKTIEIAQEFQQKMSEADYDRRIFPVLASQYDNPSYVGNALNWVLRRYGKVKPHIRYISYAPYKGASSGTVADMKTKLRADIANHWIFQSKASLWNGVGNAYDVEVILYEAGFNSGQGIINLANRNALGYDPEMKQIIKDYLRAIMDVGGAKGVMYFSGVCTRNEWGPTWGLTDDVGDLSQPMYQGAVEFISEGKTGAGVKAEYFKRTDFTELLGTVQVPIINSTWQAWGSGPLYGHKDLSTTQAVDGSIRYTGKYITQPGVIKLVAECEANDTAQLLIEPVVLFVTGSKIPFTLNYVGRFSGNGTAAVRLMAEDAAGKRTLVTPECFA